MYQVNFNQNILYQGDIIKDLPFTFLPDSSISIPDILKTTVELDSTKGFFGYTGEACVTVKYTNTGVILSQNCDIDNKKYIIISPVFPIKLRYPNSKDHLLELRKQRVKYEIHLPPIDNVMEESFIDLQVIAVVKKEAIDIKKRIAVLSDYGRSVLTEHLRDYFGRVEIKPYIESSPNSSNSSIP